MTSIITHPYIYKALKLRFSLSFREIEHYKFELRSFLKKIIYFFSFIIDINL